MLPHTTAARTCKPLQIIFISLFQREKEKNPPPKKEKHLFCPAVGGELPPIAAAANDSHATPQAATNQFYISLSERERKNPPQKKKNIYFAPPLGGSCHISTGGH
jgi:hypothetical protein